jgi:hypothetical protein
MTNLYYTMSVVGLHWKGQPITFVADVTNVPLNESLDGKVLRCPSLPELCWKYPDRFMWNWNVGNITGVQLVVLVGGRSTVQGALDIMADVLKTNF